MNNIDLLCYVYAALGISLAIAAYRRSHDVFHPAVSFTTAYCFLSTGPYLVSFLTDQAYHPGLKTYLLARVLVCSCVAMGAFWIGAFPRERYGGLRARTLFPKDCSTPVVARDLTALLTALALAVYAYCVASVRSVPGGDSYGKAEMLQLASSVQLRVYYLSAVVVQVSLMLLIVFDRAASKRRIPRISAGAIVLFFCMGLINAERDAILPMLIWVGINRFWLKRSVIMVGMLIVLALVAGVGALRVYGADLSSMYGASTSVSVFGTLQGLFVSSNIHVWTNVADHVPAREGYWLGQSLFRAIASFAPMDPYDDVTPMLWFKKIYSHQGVSGFAFGQDAEAYLNFGWLGPPLWFFAWGRALGSIYDSYMRRDHPLWAVLWWMAWSMALFGIRSDARTILKVMVYGMAIAAVIWLVAEAVGMRVSRQRQSRSLPVRRCGDLSELYR